MLTKETSRNRCSCPPCVKSLPLSVCGAYIPSEPPSLQCLHNSLLTHHMSQRCVYQPCWYHSSAPSPGSPCSCSPWSMKTRLPHDTPTQASRPVKLQKGSFVPCKLQILGLTLHRFLPSSTLSSYLTQRLSIGQQKLHLLVYQFRPNPDRLSASLYYSLFTTIHSLVR